ncbi:MAG: subtype B tannase [Vicinamibacterales bacterium]
MKLMATVSLTGLVALVASTGPFSAQTVEEHPLAFDPTSYTALRITVDDVPMEVRRYHVVYVSKPVKMAALQPRGPMGGPPPAGVLPPSGGRPIGAPTPDNLAPLNGGPAGTGELAPFRDPYAYQSMYIYVPQSAYNNAKAAIILQVNNAGWMTSPAAERVTEGGRFVSTSDTDNTGAALKAGYVVVNAGTRSRNARGLDNSWPGKAPAVVVDAKAAVRYLRYNDAVMPGSAERILITGTSGGGGLSVAVAASGNSPDYYSYLAEIGAAGVDATGRSTIRDDIFGVVAYCPISDLGHADAAYEWQYGAIRTSQNTPRQYAADIQQASATLAASYASYLDSLQLKREDGSLLSTANMQDAIVAQVRKGVEDGIARGEKVQAKGEDIALTTRGNTRLIKNDWLTVENGEVNDIDYSNFLKFVATGTTLKGAPSFDSSANTGNKGVSGENTLFGSTRVPYSNFTEFGWNHNDVKGDQSGLDDTGQDWSAYIRGPGAELAKQVKMVSPIPYLNSPADSAPYWYVRHGLADRDTSFAAQTTLYYAARNDPSIKDVNFRLVWLQGHAGNYDVREAYAWVATVLAKAGDPNATPADSARGN